jgi:hypothetical protein
MDRTHAAKSEASEAPDGMARINFQCLWGRSVGPVIGTVEIRPGCVPAWVNRSKFPGSDQVPPQDPSEHIRRS